MTAPMQNQDQERINLDEIYGGEDIPDSEYVRPKSLQEKFDAVRNRIQKGALDVGKQVLKEGVSGALGAPGNIQQLINKIPGPDFNFAPKLPQLPTSEDIRGHIENFGGPGEAETPEGRYTGKIANIYAGGALSGGVGLVPAIAGGVGGEIVKDLGGGPIWQTIAEIALMLKTGGKGGSPLKSTNSKVQSKINELRALGYSDQDITLAIKAVDKGGQKAKFASKGAKTEEAFEGAIKKSEELINDTLSQSFPGIEKGTQALHEAASDIYGKVAQEGAKIPITNSSKFIRTADGVISDLKNTLGTNAEMAPFIARLEAAIADTAKNPTAQAYMNFYKELNGIGKWLGRSQKDRLLTQVKNGIKETFKDAGPVGKKFNERFEKANAAVKKAYDAEDVSNLIARATTDQGINFTKLKNIFDKKENIDLLNKTLGAQQANNLKTIARTGKEIGDFDKAYTGLRKSLKVDIIQGAGTYGIGQAVLEGDYETVALLLAAKLGVGGAKNIARKLAEKSLTDPKYQNLVIRSLDAIKRGSPQALQRSTDAMHKYLAEEGIEVDFD